MSPLDADLVRRKLATLARNLQDLGRVEGMPLDEYRADRFLQKGTERLLQESVEAAVDTNLHLLRSRGHPVPSDYFQSFTELGRQGMIPQPLADSLAPSAGLRNRLVHEYDRLDDAIVLDAVRTARVGFAAYLRAIERHIDAETSIPETGDTGTAPPTKR
jgi:uncharacterized protein YutE (UPF0331/DUF86 family)